MNKKNKENDTVGTIPEMGGRVKNRGRIQVWYI
jgi:hypothetical protein